MRNIEMSWQRGLGWQSDWHRREENHNESSCKPKDRNAPTVYARVYAEYGFKLKVLGCFFVLK